MSCSPKSRDSYHVITPIYIDICPPVYICWKVTKPAGKSQPKIFAFSYLLLLHGRKWTCSVESCASDVKMIISNTALESTQSYLIPKVSHLSSKLYFLAKYSFLDNLLAAYIFSWHTCCPKGCIYLIPLPSIDANFLGNFPPYIQLKLTQEQDL